jgi:ribulose-bisphosphate carboxylase large chain
VDRFSVTYRILADDIAAARGRALDISVEQTVEIPRAIVPHGFVEDEILGRVEAVRPHRDGEGVFAATISYSSADVGGDFLQLLNIVFGNCSIKTGMRVESIDLGDDVSAMLRGPRFGRDGLRTLLGVAQGPLLMSAIKPVGLPTRELADIAYQFALGGMDMIKDDHGLVDQPTAPFRERVRACVEAVGEANAKSGRNSIFVANITGSARGFDERAYFAKETGAGGVMVAPALQGYAAVEELAADAGFGLPIISHPAFSGANVIAPDIGFSHAFYYGQLQRMMGADAVVYPNFGGRFGFSVEECRAIVSGSTSTLSGLKPILPAPGGGMSIEKAPGMAKVYGEDVIYLIGGALLSEPDDLVGACRRLAEAVGRGN